MNLWKFGMFLSVIACAFLLSSYQVHCNGDEESLVRGINSYRKSLKLSNLTKHSKAGCLADEIADELQYHVWNGTAEFSGCDPTGAVARLVDFPKYLRSCDIQPNATAAGVVLPVNMPKMNGDLLLTNYTHSAYAKFLNNSKFTAAGVGIKDKWVVLVLATADPDGNFSAAAGLLAAAAESLVVLVLGLFATLFLIS